MYIYTYMYIYIYIYIEREMAIYSDTFTNTFTNIACKTPYLYGAERCFRNGVRRGFWKGVWKRYPKFVWREEKYTICSSRSSKFTND